MFKDDRAGCDAPGGNEYAAPAAASIRHLGLAAPLRGGAWVLPTISAQVPVSIKPLQGAQPQMVAQFALAAHKSGLRLDDEPFTTMQTALRSQLQRYLAELRPARSYALPIDLHLDIHDAKLVFWGEAQVQLPLILLKSTVLRLNRLAPSLGAELANLISDMHRYGLGTYDISRIEYLAEHFVTYGTSTDEEMFEAMGEYDPYAEDAAEVLANMRECYHLIPSTIAKAFGGEEGAKARKQAKRISAAQLLALSARAKGRDRQLIAAMHELKQLITKAGRGGRHDYHQNDCDSYWIGAMAFILWEDVEVPSEIVEHAERSAYESGEAEEVIFRFEASLKDQADWPRIIAAIKFFLERYAAFSKLLGLLPREE